MILQIDNLCKKFGGVNAVDGVTLSVQRGHICSVIGPNGAGKTTLFNLISGYIKPDSGRIHFLEQDITGRTPQNITKRGIARSFQIVNIFPRLSVYENIMVAVLAHERKHLSMMASAKSIGRIECSSIIEVIGLVEEAVTPAGQLSHGDQKRLEVGIALAMKPKLLLLDEPTAGMAAEEKAGILASVRKMCQSDCTVFLCEHDMSVIFGISDFIWVMHNGKVIASGSIETIKSNELVRKVYLGEKI